MMTRDNVENAILDVIRATMTDKGLAPAHLSAGSPVDSQLGLDSLDWAAVVVRLEGSLGIDPFLTGALRQLRTVNDLVEVYWRAIQGNSANAGQLPQRD